MSQERLGWVNLSPQPRSHEVRLAAPMQKYGEGQPCAKGRRSLAAAVAKIDVSSHPGRGTASPTLTRSMPTKVRNRFTLLLLKNRRRVSAS